MSVLFFCTGSEFGIVLLSTVRSQPHEKLPVIRNEDQQIDIGWRREKMGFITDRHQICVGITRCKYGLVIVGMYLGIDTTVKKIIFMP